MRNFLFIFALLSCFSVQAQNNSIPEHYTPLNDLTNFVKPTDKQALEKILNAYKDSSKVEIILLLSPKEKKDLEEQTQEAFEKWGLNNTKIPTVLLACNIMGIDAKMKANTLAEAKLTPNFKTALLQDLLPPALQNGLNLNIIHNSIDVLRAQLRGQALRPAYPRPPDWALLSCGAFLLYYILVAPKKRLKRNQKERPEEFTTPPLLAYLKYMSIILIPLVLSFYIFFESWKDFYTSIAVGMFFTVFFHKLEFWKLKQLTVIKFIGSLVMVLIFVGMLVGVGAFFIGMYFVLQENIIIPFDIDNFIIGVGMILSTAITANILAYILQGDNVFDNNAQTLYSTQKPNTNHDNKNTTFVYLNGKPVSSEEANALFDKLIKQGGDSSPIKNILKGIFNNPNTKENKPKTQSKRGGFSAGGGIGGEW